MDGIIEFLNDKKQTVLITDYNNIIGLISEYCVIGYENIGNNKIKIIKHNVDIKYELLREPIPGSLYIGDNLYIHKEYKNSNDNNTLKIFLNNFSKTLSDELYYFLIRLNTVGLLSHILDNKYVIKAINKYPNSMKVKKLKNFYILYVIQDVKILLVGMFNTLNKAYYVLNLHAYNDINTLKIIPKYKYNKCISSCKNFVNPFCHNDHGNNGYLYCRQQLEYLQEFGLCDFLLKKVHCQDYNCQGYHIFKISSPSRMSLCKKENSPLKASI